MVGSLGAKWRLVGGIVGTLRPRLYAVVSFDLGHNVRRRSLLISLYKATKLTIMERRGRDSLSGSLLGSEAGDVATKVRVRLCLLI